MTDDDAADDGDDDEQVNWLLERLLRLVSYLP
jgi:hypothetical protein